MLFSKRSECLNAAGSSVTFFICKPNLPWSMLVLKHGLPWWWSWFSVMLFLFVFYGFNVTFLMFSLNALFLLCIFLNIVLVYWCVFFLMVLLFASSTTNFSSLIGSVFFSECSFWLLLLNWWYFSVIEDMVNKIKKV